MIATSPSPPSPSAAEIGIVEPASGKGAICESILRSLPDWFGIESSLVQYVADVEGLPMLVATGADGVPKGFLAWRVHFPGSAEIHVMGVAPDRHRRGIGTRLVAELEARLRREGGVLLQVKTVGPSRPCDAYARTRAFYESVGFRPLEEIPTLWDAANPCLIMVKALSFISAVPR